MTTKQKLGFSSDRRWGMELEVNSFDGKSRHEGPQPVGIDEMALIVSQATELDTSITVYSKTNSNPGWVLKPDNSCGIEICSPVSKGWSGIKRVCKVVRALQVAECVKADHRCSNHLHIEVADLTTDQVAKIVGYWLKMEGVFMDSLPDSRKCNRYCQPLSKQSIVSHDELLSSQELLKRFGASKYVSLNSQTFLKGSQKTLEFRIGEGDGCKDPWYVKNWVRLLLHFVEIVKDAEPLAPVDTGARPLNQWQGYLMLDPKDCFKVLGFDGTYELSPGLKEVRNWWIARMLKNLKNNKSRSYAMTEVVELAKEHGVTVDCLVPADMEKALYNEETKN